MSRDLLLIAMQLPKLRKAHRATRPVFSELRRARHDQLRREVLPLRRRLLRAARQIFMGV